MNDAINIEELERLAIAVKDWRCDRSWMDTSEDEPAFVVGTIDEDGNEYPVITVDCEQYFSGDSKKLADFYACANPDAVLSLIARLKSAEAERDALAAKLAELEGQEPAAWMLECPTMTGDTGWLLSWSRSGAGVCNRLQGDQSEKPLYARSAPAEQPVNARLLEAAKGVISWTNAGDRPPVRDEIETGRMTGVRVHALADLFDAIVAADPSMKSKFDQNAMSSQSGFDFSSLLPDKQQPTVQTPSFKCGLCFDTGVLPKPMIAPEPPDTPCPNGCKASAERTTVRSKRRTEQTETPWPKES